MIKLGACHSLLIPALIINSMCCLFQVVQYQPTLLPTAKGSEKMCCSHQSPVSSPTSWWSTLENRVVYFCMIFTSWWPLHASCCWWLSMSVMVCLSATHSHSVKLCVKRTSLLAISPLYHPVSIESPPYVLVIWVWTTQAYLIGFNYSKRTNMASPFWLEKEAWEKYEKPLVSESCLFLWCVGLVLLILS
jgi:hypothetical protein